MENAKIIKPTPEQAEVIKKWQESKKSPMVRMVERENKRHLEEIRERSKKLDVTYDLNRWFREGMQNNDPELMEIQKNGFISEAVKWVESLTPERMKFGTASKEQRIEEAKKYAKLAGLTLEQILKDYNLKLPE